MYITVLLIHIIFAVVTIAASIVAIHKAGSPSAPNAVTRTWQGFAATAISGLGLVAIAPHVLGHFCAIASVYITGIVLVHLYVRAKAKELAV